MNGWVFTGAHRNGKQVWRFVGEWQWELWFMWDTPLWPCVQPESCR